MVMVSEYNNMTVTCLTLIVHFTGRTIHIPISVVIGVSIAFVLVLGSVIALLVVGIVKHHRKVDHKDDIKCNTTGLENQAVRVKSSNSLWFIIFTNGLILV